MGNTIAQPILRVVPPLTNHGDSPPTPVPAVSALSGAVLLPPPPPPPPEDSAAPAAERRTSTQPRWTSRPSCASSRDHRVTT